MLFLFFNTDCEEKFFRKNGRESKGDDLSDSSVAASLLAAFSSPTMSPNREQAHGYNSPQILRRLVMMKGKTGRSNETARSGDRRRTQVWRTNRNCPVGEILRRVANDVGVEGDAFFQQCQLDIFVLRVRLRKIAGAEDDGRNSGGFIGAGIGGVRWCNEFRASQQAPARFCHQLDDGAVERLFEGWVKFCDRTSHIVGADKLADDFLAGFAG